MERDDTRLVVEVVYAHPDQQTILSIVLPRGSTIQDAIKCSGIVQMHPEIAAGTLTAGVFGRRRALDAPLRDGDRVEIYRPLGADPKETRRAQAHRKGGSRARGR
jgi:putative ubiquitin-RnfH superfamily antitoxin RatB of RatAB toxin-antitoxin module